MKNPFNLFAACLLMGFFALSAINSVYAASGLTVDYTAVNRFTALTPAQIQAARSAKILVRHASVGQNISAGLNALAQANAAYDRGNFVFQARGNPGWRKKIDDLVEQTRVQSADFTIFSMKFCYIDGAADADVYMRAMEKLEASYPRKKFVWWTMPMKTAGDSGIATFNMVVRAYAASHGKILFDLASIESHPADGSTRTENGQEILCPEYSSDGGHLNGAGALRVAQAFWVLMAELNSTRD